MMTFSEALEFVKAGAKITRTGWNGKGLWLEQQNPDENSKMTHPYLFINYPPSAMSPDGIRVPWLASQTDLQANDWELVEDGA